MPLAQSNLLIFFKCVNIKFSIDIIKCVDLVKVRNDDCFPLLFNIYIDWLVALSMFR